MSLDPDNDHESYLFKCEQSAFKLTEEEWNSVCKYLLKKHTPLIEPFKTSSIRMGDSVFVISNKRKCFFLDHKLCKGFGDCKLKQIISRVPELTNKS